MRRIIINNTPSGEVKPVKKKELEKIGDGVFAPVDRKIKFIEVDYAGKVIKEHN